MVEDLLLDSSGIGYISITSFSSIIVSSKYLVGLTCGRVGK